MLNACYRCNIFVIAEVEDMEDMLDLPVWMFATDEKLVGIRATSYGLHRLSHMEKGKQRGSRKKNISMGPCHGRDLHEARERTIPASLVDCQWDKRILQRAREAHLIVVGDGQREDYSANSIFDMHVIDLHLSHNEIGEKPELLDRMFAADEEPVVIRVTFYGSLNWMYVDHVYSLRVCQFGFRFIPS
ncbi:unnamed protein product [Arabis nemorensis]|uniref:Uncharacterized protein n=1 Tax=Arabis nemorensis TaxID=586526 RepID=A0A565BT78_9BRAS|nr:unnamed protein product [Arabis nemorensis]